MKILGVSCFFHDSAACLVVDGKIVAAAAEERFSRIKHDNSFPHKAIDYCLQEAGLAINELDVIGFYEKPLIKFERIIHQHIHHFPKSHKAFFNSVGGWVNQKLNIRHILKEECHYFGKVVFIPHHLSHAASAYYLSPYKESCIVTIDGVGEWATTTMGHAQGTQITLAKEIQFPHSLGLLYSSITTFLGFSANDAEYKVMGLAAYGKPDQFRAEMKQLIKIHDDGSYSLNMKYFDFDWAEHMFSGELEKLFGFPAREPESQTYRHHENLAAALQERLEEVVFALLRKAQNEFPSKNLCLSGGVALNSVMNGKILSNTSFQSLFIPPDPSDAGGAMGVALFVHEYQNKIKTSWNFSPYLGPSFSWFQIETTLRKRNLSYKILNPEQLVEKAASLLVQQKVLGWFQGRMEWGPRALGARSILAAANTAKMKDIINEKVKHRELFRPFAPVIPEEFVQQYFQSDDHLSISAKWMLMVYPFRKEAMKLVPAVVHVDGSGRLQTLSKSDNLLYYNVLERYYQKTDIPIIINTSFNVRGEPIVCTPDDAINCFLKTDIDYLFIDNYMVYKND